MVLGMVPFYCLFEDGGVMVDGVECLSGLMSDEYVYTISTSV